MIGLECLMKNAVRHIKLFFQMLPRMLRTHHAYKPLVITFFLLVGMPLAGCDAYVKLGNFDKDQTNALARVEEFRKFNDEQNYAGLYEIAAPALKSTVTREQFIATAQAYFDHLGKYKSSMLVGSSCLPNEVRLVYHTDFEKEKVTELIVWSVPKDEALLVFYQTIPGHDEVKQEGQVGCSS